MRLAVLIAAASEWARVLAGPLALLCAGAVLLGLTVAVGIDRFWLVAMCGALVVGLAIGWAGFAATGHAARQRERQLDGEGESL